MDLLLNNVSVDFGETKALDGLSVNVSAGERVAVIGSSGAGKSTLFRVITRGVAATGEVCVDGRELYSLPRAKLSEVRRRIGTIRQAYDLVPQLSAGMNVALGDLGGMHGLRSLMLFLRGPDADLSRRVEAALESVGLPEKPGSKTSELSGGQQQRVAVARLLVQNPSLVLADEPFSAVDQVTSRRVLEALTELNRDGATLLVNLHDVELAKSFPRVLALKDGRLVYDGKPDTLTDGELRRIYAGDPGRSRNRESPEEPRTARPRTPIPGGMDGVSAH
ncbi:phosphonate ABC transporter ATP-binding protein [Rubrobacter indicoceani]|uniref:phosphonate ABC transporter ATP-binding protein n=1 Tax=Rubrobacter indicoceani TaxID=2051957 RepID=UPI000E5C2DCE|nr:ATP-binding cassette domain-containing protein [Rubrobacter indicoceani]